MKPNFMDRTAKIIEEVRNRSRINVVDTEVIEAMLKDALIEYHNEVFTYARNIGYGDGLNEAVATEEVTYDRGFEDGRAEAESDNEAYTKEAVESAYEEGYSLGYSEGNSEGYDKGYDDGYDDGKMQTFNMSTS